MDEVLAAYPEASLKDDADEIRDGIREAIATAKGGNEKQEAPEDTPAKDQEATPPAQD
jgi:hypothetical protein